MDNTDKNRKFLSPLGVSDVLEGDCVLKNKIEARVAKVFNSFGYNEIQTPTFEYFNVFADDLSIAHEDIIKFIDSTGKILALRPDYTTAISRLAVSRMSEAPLPLRLRYCGSIFRAGESYTEARQKEFTQAGAELFGSASPEADAEVIIMTIEALRAAGLKEFQLELGHTGFLRGITRELPDEAAAKLSALIDKKFIPGIEDFCEREGISGDVKELLCEMPNLYGDISVADEVRRRTLSPESAAALENLAAVCRAVEEYGLEKYISIDLGLVRSFKYYTGIVFKGITHGLAFPVCGGGRYDSLTRRFGQGMAATGTAVWIDRVMAAVSRGRKADSRPRTDVLIWYENDTDRADAYALAAKERVGGKRVICEKHDFKNADEVCKYLAERRILSAAKVEGGAK